MRNEEDEDMEREKRLMCGIMNGGKKSKSRLVLEH
jgi:hypothetical protein